MTIGKALNEYFNSFGINAYPDTSDLEGVTFPYMTYSTQVDGFGHEVSITAQAWFKTDSEATPNAKVKEIMEAIGMGGKTLAYDDGIMWLKCGNPFCINSTAQNDASLKLRQMNITIEFL